MKQPLALPVRKAPATGDANERQMMERAIDLDGFETVRRTRPDGSVVQLQSRGGWPHFSVSGDRVAATTEYRGFMARSIGETYAAIYDPYDLEIEVNRYVPAAVTYYVSGVQAASYEPRNWLDVWSWDGTALRINGTLARSFYPMRYPEGVVNAIPYIIPWPSAPIYGNKTLNAPYPKRVFAVGAEQVGIFVSATYPGSEIPNAVLSPEAPRAAHKALVCGAGITPAEHLAILSQLYFTGEAWDSFSGGWEHSTTKVAMLLTAPFLEQTNLSATVDLPIMAFTGPVASSGTWTKAVTLPVTEIGAFCKGEVWASTDYTYDPGGSSGHFEVAFPWRGVLSSSLPGTLDSNYTRSAYSGAVTSIHEQGGVELTYSGSGTKHLDTSNERYAEHPSSITVSGDAYVSNFGGAALNADTTSLFWTDDSLPGSVSRSRGSLVLTTAFDGGLGTNAIRYYDTQEGEFSVAMEDFDLVKMVFAREKTTGDKAILTPVTGYYANQLADPYANLWDDIGWGTICGPVVIGYYWDTGPDIVPIREYYLVSGGEQAPEAVVDINNAYHELVDAVAAQTAYSNEIQDAVYRPHYNGYKLTDVTEDALTLTWQTKDFILYDKTNEVYLSIDGDFDGEQGVSGDATAMLKVYLTIKTPDYDERKTLVELPLTYPLLLPSKTVSPGFTGIPAPRVRAIFAPKYRDQGAFPGAAYIVAAEAANGAAPAFLVNFLLKLEPYSSIASEAPTDRAVHFIPCNLLEMLYAFVYSQEMGVHASLRYPVTNTAVYTTIMEELFAVEHSIQFRDGSFGNWLSTFGNPYHSDQKTELSRI